MKPALYVILDDRDAPKGDTSALIGDIRFGDLLRRRQRYIDELRAAAVRADKTFVLRTAEDADQLIRRIETTRGQALWLRLPTFAAPLDMAPLKFLIGKLRYALDPMMLAPVLEDDAPMLLFSRDAEAAIAAKPGAERRSFVLRMQDDLTLMPHGLSFVDLRNAEGVQQFLFGATEPRGFNALAARDGVYVKSSADVEKMRAEHGFFELASPAMRRFLLPTFGFEQTDGKASYRMEQLNVPDAALRFVLGTFSESEFTRLTDQFFAFINARDKAEVGSNEVTQKGKVQILDKLNRRAEDFSEMAEGERVTALLKTGGLPGGLEGLNQRATPLTNKALENCDLDYLALSHGDPCLSNILFDSRTGLVRFIDPRGATSRDHAMMHPLYDIAKFSHSVLGGYDFVNNALFTVELDEALALDLRLHRGGPPDWVKSAFKDRLAREGWDYRQVRAVEVSLFLSMLPLHRDHPQKLLGFALIARSILDELEDSQ